MYAIKKKWSHIFQTGRQSSMSRGLINKYRLFMNRLTHHRHRHHSSQVLGFIPGGTQKISTWLRFDQEPLSLLRRWVATRMWNLSSNQWRLRWTLLRIISFCDIMSKEVGMYICTSSTILSIKSLDSKSLDCQLRTRSPIMAIMQTVIGYFNSLYIFLKYVQYAVTFPSIPKVVLYILYFTKKVC